jgi:hypothetical protein
MDTNVSMEPAASIFMAEDKRPVDKNSRFLYNSSA